MTARAIALACIALVACGASTQPGAPNPNDAGAADTSSQASACPSALPTAGDACTLSSSIACEYGTDVDSACDPTAVCGQGKWSISSLDAGVTCPTPAASGACPSTYEAVTLGADCPQAQLICGYSEGWCVCVPPGGPPQQGAQPQWACDKPAAGCPLPRPRLGSACASEGQSCDYGGCSLAQGVVEQCTGGSWEPVQSECPASRRSPEN